ncbi:virescein [Pieris rapae]|uniref:virescein n=1 Tax=Pieris rapae TaxID=64459 RepID=UPI001E280D9A|nr:virescein [Pieris rapae]
MDFRKIFLLIVLSVFAIFGSEARPGKIPKAVIKKGAKLGNGLKALNVASTVHDIYSALHHKKKKH